LIRDPILSGATLEEETGFSKPDLASFKVKLACPAKTHLKASASSKAIETYFIQLQPAFI